MVTLTLVQFQTVEKSASSPSHTLVSLTMAASRILPTLDSVGAPPRSIRMAITSSAKMNLAIALPIALIIQADNLRSCRQDQYNSSLQVKFRPAPDLICLPSLQFQPM